MTTPTQVSDPNRRLEEIIAILLQQLDDGKVIDEQEWLHTYPEFNDQLLQFFDDQKHFERLAVPLKPNDATPTYPSQPFGGSAFQPVGQVIGEYEILEEVARGGMGIVFRARHQVMNRIVALKMILHGVWAQGEDLVRFRAEAESVASLDHPHIVPIYEIGSHADHPFFTMKWIDGGSLSKHKERLSGLFRNIAQLVRDTARAIHHAHQRGIIHRDLKPANILLTGSIPDSMIPYVTDFGLARRIDTDGLTQSGAILGTPNYMAPEQAAGLRDLSVAVDVYGLGAILYELLVGRKLFQDDSQTPVLVRVQAEEPVAPLRINPHIPRDLETICRKCLAKEPARRYASAEALADDLDRWLKGEPIKARPAGRLKLVWLWSKRRPAQATAAAMILAIGLAASAAVLWQWRVAERERALAERARDEARREAEERRQAELREAGLRREAQSALDRAQRMVLLQRVTLAEGMARWGKTDRAIALLDSFPFGARRWDWSEINWVCGRQERAFWRADGVIKAHFLPDGSVLAMERKGMLVQLDARTGKERHPVMAVQSAVDFAVGPDGRKVAM